ncbi:hypothetical protein HOLleu_29303 [Holothuria leucospilota]|uniref:Uncharacterized protein n=1 Tax=Holothuria leucospilota TaxID=206669 RepID=A0A9Q1BNN9_HOLLE|nr:hypothetical protein HOLleu_29303 [Holothuria leucospilota]
MVQTESMYTRTGCTVIDIWSKEHKCKHHYIFFCCVGLIARVTDHLCTGTMLGTTNTWSTVEYVQTWTRTCRRNDAYPIKSLLRRKCPPSNVQECAVKSGVGPFGCIFQVWKKLGRQDMMTKESGGYRAFFGEIVSSEERFLKGTLSQYPEKKLKKTSEY